MLAGVSSGTSSSGRAAIAGATVAWVAAACLGLPARGQDAAPAAGYATVGDAVEAAIAFHTVKDYAQGRAAAARALELAGSDAERVRIHRAMLRSYRAAPDWEPMAESLEFISDTSELEAERSLARRELIAFAHHRGKVDDLVTRCEERLARKPENEAVLATLGEIFMRPKPNPRRAAEMLERLGAVRAKAGRELGVGESADLAGEYVKDRRFKQGAELFEKTAAREAKLAAWHWKEAAAAWQKGGDKERSLAAARAAERSEPEARSDILAHFWHRGLADVYFEAGEFGASIPHYEEAIRKTTIDGYRKDCEQRLGEARRKLSAT